MCAKSDKTKGLEAVTVSSNSISSLPESNKYFEFSFQAPFDAAGLSEEQMSPKKIKVQQYYIDYLQSVQHGVSHDIYFRWTKLTESPLTYKLQAYIKPAPMPLNGPRSGVQGGSDPPSPPPPPPPPMY
jgi:hypothetical protein